VPRGNGTAIAQTHPESRESHSEIVRLPKRAKPVLKPAKPIADGGNHMKKMFAVAAFALALGACSEAQEGPFGPQFVVNGSSSDHTLPTPDITGAVVAEAVGGYSVTLAISGSFGAGTDGRHYEVFSNGTKVGDSDASGVFVHSPVEAGDYVYTAKTKSKSGTGKSTMTYHSAISEGFSVTVGASPTVYTINNFAGNCGSGSYNSGNFTLTFTLYADGVAVTADPGLTNAGGVTSWGNTPSLTFAAGGFSTNAGNPAEAASYSWVFQIGGQTILTRACERT
jgi:hypothetical protein